MLLFAAARAQIIQTVIEPALAAGKWVIADRFLPSTIAMQYHARGYIKYYEDGAYAGMIDDESIEDIGDLTRMSIRSNNERFGNLLIPDLTIFLMPSEEILNARAAKRGGLDRLEDNPEYVAKVREGYRLLTCGERLCNNVTDGKNYYAGMQYTRVKAVICQNHEEDEDAITQMVKRCISGLFYTDRQPPATERAA
jgi:dTMP kinase